jgi:hypothetical protein
MPTIPVLICPSPLRGIGTRGTRGMRESMATSRAGTSVGDRGERVERLHAIPAGAKQEFQPPPDEWTLDRERAERKRGVKRERERSYDDEYSRERESARGGSPRSDVDDY